MIGKPNASGSTENQPSAADPMADSIQSPDPGNGASLSRDDRPSQEQFQALQQECQRLNQDLALARQERNHLFEALRTLLPTFDGSLTEEEMLAQMAQMEREKPLREFLDELLEDGKD